MLFLGATLLIGLVTAVLNLDTSVAFLTPVLIYAARSRGGGEAPLLFGCILLSNAGSLFLPGSNLTNLIVLSHLRLTGREFLSVMWAPAMAALVVTALVIVVAQRRELHLRTSADRTPERRRVIGLGLVGVVVATGLILGAALARPRRRDRGARRSGGAHRSRPGTACRNAADVLGLPVLVGLFGIAVGLGTLGRVWSGPAALLAHVDLWGTAVVAAVASVALNNLPAASLLAARTPAHPLALLVGLNLGPNLFVTGSLSWFLWYRVAQRTGSHPSLRRASALGAIAVPLSMIAALGVLAAKGVG